ncbi:LysM domain-containing protein [Sanguibacter gelidistatuariae]|uniref:LysM domain-containing protein n=1 Tax=Sanguibacter gelidistatuariae TaxID=1814289 RepID=A0A1G6RF69_9MICO|nr:LysM peptidoglycan-binding domain-containing protein [Sanguibacter gelidistatuariae]SDD02667.1 LysM domain-containing protein [Sanguibacter gelidistatuariae]
MPASRSAASTTTPAPSRTRTAGRYALRYGTTGLALAAASIVAAASSSSADESYDVASGDTVSGIAAQTGASPASIRSANNLDAQFRIRAGQRLVIPSATGSAAPAPTSTPAASHRVVAGDTVSALALRYGTTASSIISSNNLGTNALIRIGQTLSIGTTTTSSSAPSKAAPTTELVGDTFAGRTYSRDVVSAANQNKAALLASSVPSKDQMRSMVAATAIVHGVDPSLALAIATQESGFDQRAVSPANAIGTMQVIPTSGDWASDLVGYDLNLLDAQHNVTAGVAILARLVETSPSLDDAIAGYYQGQTSVRKYGMFDDTRRYVANVRTLAAQQ